MFVYFSWTIMINGAKNTVFAGEEFKLQIKFTPRYPFEAPIVSFVTVYLLHTFLE